MFTTSKRIAKFEFIRVIAMILALCFYVSRAFPTFSTIDQTGIGFVSFSVILKLAAPFFFFLCGRFALNLDFSDKSLKEFYFKKMVYIVIPMAMFMTAHYALLVKGDKGFNFFEFLPFAAAAFDNLNYWFMYRVLFFILLAPILSLTFKDISDRAAISFISLGLFFNLCAYYLPMIPDYKFIYTNQFGNVIFYFFVGGLSDRLVNIIGKKKLYIAGIISFVAVMLQTYFLESDNDKFDYSPVYVVFAFSLYVFLTSIYKEGNKFTDNILLFLGKYSFYVCMIHGILTSYIANNILLQTNNFWLFEGVGVVILMLVSIVLSVFLDALVFRTIRIVSYRLLNFFDNIK